MDLASLSLPNIKRFLRIVSLEEDVLEALMLAKRLGPDVRERKRRQFNYIGIYFSSGKLLREAEPELMDALIQTAKDDDDPIWLKALSVSEAWARSNNVIDEDDVNDYMGENEIDVEDSSSYASIADRWFNGLIDNDVEITCEVYSICNVDFDRRLIVAAKTCPSGTVQWRKRPGPANEVEAALKSKEIS